MPKYITATNARHRFGEVLRDAQKGEAVIVERSGRPVVAIVPIEQYRQWQQARQVFFELVEKAQQRTRQYPPEEMLRLVDEAIQVTRV